MFKNKNHHFVSKLIIFLVLSFLLSACGTEESPRLLPQELISSQELILSPQELKTWIDNDYSDYLGRRVIILDTSFDWSFNTRPIYDSGHIPGAYYVEPLTFYQPRSDGPIMAPGMVPNGQQMDNFIQKHGIDKNTTIVFTGNHAWGTTRSYWAFRYWGFQRHQLFVLNGKANTNQSVWTDAGYSLQIEEPSLPPRSNFSVSEWPGNMDKVRASTEEFMQVAEGKIANTIIVDARAKEEWDAYAIVPESSAFGFRTRNSVWERWTNLLVGGEEGLHIFRPYDEIASEFDGLGITEDMTVYSFCMAGGRAAVIFFVCDAILKRPVKINDGSSSELGQLAYLKDEDGNDICLPEDSPWRFDLYKYCDVIQYNYPTTNVVPPIIVDPYAATANQINETDKLYYQKKEMNQ